MSDYTVRPAQTDETERIYELVTRIFSGEQAIPAEYMRIEEEKHPRWWTAVTPEGEIIGCLAGWTTADGKTELGRFAVEPGHRREGIGRAMVLTAMRTLFDEGVEEIYGDGRPATVQLVLSLGGEVLGPAEEFFIGTVTPVVVRKEKFRDPERV